MVDSIVEIPAVLPPVLKKKLQKVLAPGEKEIRFMVRIRDKAQRNRFRLTAERESTSFKDLKSLLDELAIILDEQSK